MRRFASHIRRTDPVTKSVLPLFHSALPHQLLPACRSSPSRAQMALHDHQLGMSPAGHLGNSHWKVRPAAQPMSMRSRGSWPRLLTRRPPTSSPPAAAAAK
ncbi:uncharacterized protein LOC142589071 [Dermacentor variabilis]|uniref:uncharacterized protein LOC142589071 n=1 Tax=Dermacentor variabilis TaxID=34621 RepID=UPI003F5BA70C